MSATGGGQYRNQGRVAADGGDAGPMIGPNKGPVDRRDIAIAVGAIALVVAGIVALLAL